MEFKYGILLFILLQCLVRESVSLRKFPKDFRFGVATSAYQVEGGSDFRGPNNWDEITRRSPSLIKDHSNGDIACDSYHKYKEDVAMLKDLGVKYYRFSISWSRVLPMGTINNINEDGIKYYDNLINELLVNGIEPMITLCHLDLPLNLDKLGGFNNDLIKYFFADYANLMFQRFGDRVKVWTTFNEPKSFCFAEDLSEINGSGYFGYKCAHNMLKSHAKVYHIYNDTYKTIQGGRISIVLNLDWDDAGSDLEIDRDAAERKRQFEFGLYAHPIFFGNYPQVVIDQVNKNSKEQGFNLSRLPVFTQDEQDYIKGTQDYLALNSYSAWMVKDDHGEVDKKHPSFDNDLNTYYYKNANWSGSPVNKDFKVAPKEFRKLLKWVKKTYNNPEIFVSENGYCDDGRLNDTERIHYYKSYITELLKAMYEDHVNVTRYTAWSLMDNFEWIDGYTSKYGLYHVDFNSPNRTRTPKLSANYYKTLIETRCPVDDCTD